MTQCVQCIYNKIKVNTNEITFIGRKIRDKSVIYLYIRISRGKSLKRIGAVKERVILCPHGVSNIIFKHIY